VVLWRLCGSLCCTLVRFGWGSLGELSALSPDFPPKKAGRKVMNCNVCGCAAHLEVASEAREVESRKVVLEYVMGICWVCFRALGDKAQEVQIDRVTSVARSESGPSQAGKVGFPKIPDGESN